MCLPLVMCCCRKIKRNMMISIFIKVFQRMSSPDPLQDVPALELSQNEPKVSHFVGKYDYLAQTNYDLSFKKGESLYIISDDGDWWYARAQDSGQEGYIPSNYIVEYGTIDTEE